MKILKDPEARDLSPLVCAHVSFGACDSCKYPFRPRYIINKHAKKNPVTVDISTIYEAVDRSREEVLEAVFHIFQ